MGKNSICFLSCCCHIFFSFRVWSHGKYWANAVKIKKFHDLDIDELNCLLGTFPESLKRGLKLKSPEFLSWRCLSFKLFLWDRHFLRWRGPRIHEKTLRGRWKLTRGEERRELLRITKRGRSCIPFWAGLPMEWWNRGWGWLNSGGNGINSNGSHGSVIGFIGDSAGKFFSIGVQDSLFGSKFDWSICQFFIQNVNYLSKASIEFPSPCQRYSVSNHVKTPVLKILICLIFHVSANGC